jgi:hypothetical protein
MEADAAHQADKYQPLPGLSLWKLLLLISFTEEHSGVMELSSNSKKRLCSLPPAPLLDLRVITPSLRVHF